MHTLSLAHIHTQSKTNLQMSKEYIRLSSTLSLLAGRHVADIKLPSLTSSATANVIITAFSHPPITRTADALRKKVT